MAFGRVRLYHFTNRAGKVFDNEVDYLAHVDRGWVDSPFKIVNPDTTPPDRGKEFDNEADYLADLMADSSTQYITPEELPAPVETEAAPEPAPKPIPEPPKVAPPVKAKKPGRQPKKSKGGK